MSDKRNPAGPPFFHQAGEPHQPSTLRSIEVAEEIAADTEQLAAPVYVEPQPLVSPSDHKTLEIQTVKLADDIDPRKLPTELRLVRPPSVPPDSGWPLSEAGLAATQPPIEERNRWRTRVGVVLLLALFLLGSGLVLRTRRATSAASTAGSTSAVAASLVAPSVTAAASSAVDSAASAAPEPPPSASSASADSTASAEPANDEAPPPKHHGSHAGAKTKAVAAPPPASDPTSPNLSKPKRAIY